MFTVTFFNFWEFSLFNFEENGSVLSGVLEMVKGWVKAFLIQEHIPCYFILIHLSSFISLMIIERRTLWLEYSAKGEIGMTRSRLEVNSFDSIRLNQKGHIKVNFHDVLLVHTVYCWVVLNYMNAPVFLFSLLWIDIWIASSLWLL